MVRDIATCLYYTGIDPFTDCLILAQPPKEAIEARRHRANDPDYYHTVANPAKGEKPGERGLPNTGYRPGRKTAKRRKKNGGGPGPRP